MEPIFTPIDSLHNTEIPQIMIRSPLNGFRINNKAIKSPKDMPEELMDFLAEATVEHLLLVIVGTDLKPISYSIIAKGNIREAIFSIPEILRCCLLTAGCFGCFLLHNHSSVHGDKPVPSKEDRQAQRQLGKALEMMGFQFLDSIIVDSAKRIYSFAEDGVEI